MTEPQEPSETEPAGRQNPYVQMTKLPEPSAITAASPNPYVTAMTVLPAPTRLVTTSGPPRLTPAAARPETADAPPPPAPPLEPALPPVVADVSAPVEPQAPSAPPVPQAPPVPAVPRVPMVPAEPGPTSPRPPSPATSERRAALDAARHKRAETEKAATRNQAGTAALIFAVIAVFLGITVGSRSNGLMIFTAIIALILAIVAFTRRGKSKGTPAVALILAIVVLISTAVSGFATLDPTADQTGGGDAVVVGDERVEQIPYAFDDNTRGGSGPGSYASPYALGEEFALTTWRGARWRIVTGEPNFDARDEVRDASEYNPIAPDGYQYVILPITYSYVKSGDGDEGNAWLDVWVELSGGDGQVYGDSYLYIFPDHVQNADLMRVGETATFNVAFLVASDAVDGALVRFTSETGALYVAIE